MAPVLVYLSVICILSLQSLVVFASESNTEIYIIHLESPKDGHFFSNNEDLHNWHHSFLPSNKVYSDNSSSSSGMVYSYRNVINGFAAWLTPEEVAALQGKEGIISVRPRRLLHAQTTHTTNFLGLHQNLGFWEKSNYGKGMIIGLLDSGIMPDHPSLHDEGVPPPPARWKGSCEFNFTACNNKLISARFFREFGNGTPLDENGHGTHTSSTAAGNFVNSANVLGLANGTASGMAPLAHVAMYKVCNATLTCSETDVLAAIDAAIEDGVDIISASIGKISMFFWSDAVALGGFSATQKGILVSAAAGNAGPAPGTVSNGAPWLLTVGASTTDRKLRATIRLGDGNEIDGESAFQPKDFSEMLLQLNFPRIDKGQFVKDAGGVGMILMNGEPQGFTTTADFHVLPAAHVSYVDGLKIIAYMNSTSNPQATFLYKGTIFGDDHAPAIAAFSSRGPNLASPGILKPDIIGPGVSILAAWPIPVANDTDTKSTFNIISGTSMSCPHLSGVATLVKSSHPDWSPGAIKSAIMTTADLVNLRGRPIEDERGLSADFFSSGAGHVNPLRANDPGLIYDIQPEDYIPYLCGLNYSNRVVSMFLLKKVNCSSTISEAELNYPSFSIRLGLTAQTYTRTVTNVGEAVSSYVVKIVPPQGVDVKVEPALLDFSEMDFIQALR